MTQAIAEAGLIPRREIEVRANRLLEEKGHGKSVPVDPFALSTDLGITVRAYQFNDPSLSGMLIRRPDGPEILVKSDDPPVQQGFTVAHELGHYLLHPEVEEFADGEANLYRQVVLGDPDGVTRSAHSREVQANMFAAALLMPEEKVRAVWRAVKSVEKLARIFDVSPTAMWYRIDQLGLW